MPWLPDVPDARALPDVADGVGNPQRHLGALWERSGAWGPGKWSHVATGRRSGGGGQPTLTSLLFRKEMSVASGSSHASMVSGSASLTKWR